MNTKRNITKLAGSDLRLIPGKNLKSDNAHKADTMYHYRAQGKYGYPGLLKGSKTTKLHEFIKLKENADPVAYVAPEKVEDYVKAYDKDTKKWVQHRNSKKVKNKDRGFFKKLLGRDKYKLVPDKNATQKVLNDPSFSKEHKKALEFMKSNKDKGFTIKVASNQMKKEKLAMAFNILKSFKAGQKELSKELARKNNQLILNREKNKAWISQLSKDLKKGNPIDPDAYAKQFPKYASLWSKAFKALPDSNFLEKRVSKQLSKATKSGKGGTNRAKTIRKDYDKAKGFDPKKSDIEVYDVGSKNSKPNKPPKPPKPPEPKIKPVAAKSMRNKAVGFSALAGGSALAGYSYGTPDLPPPPPPRY